MGIDQERTGNRSTNNAPRNTYLTKDGHWLAISTSADSIASRVLHLVGHSEATEEPWFATGRQQRAAHADELDRYVGDWIGARTRDEVVHRFEEAGAAVAPVYKPSELLTDPQVQAMDLITSVEDPELGTMRMQHVMWRMGATPGRIRSTGRPLAWEPTRPACWRRARPVVGGDPRADGQGRHPLSPCRADARC